MNLVRKLILVGGLTSLALSVTVAAAGAKPLVRAHFHDVGSVEIPDFCKDEPDDGDSGLKVREDFDVSGNFMINSHGSAGLPYFSNTVHGTDSFTNLANGKSFTIVFNFVEKDLKVTDNGDGTLTILVNAAGGQRIYGPNGKLLFRDPGMVRYEFLIDHNGTPTDPQDDEFVEFLGIVKESTGLNETEGRDFCDDIRTFIG